MDIYLVIWKRYKKIDLILAPAIGGIVIGYEIGRILKKETIFCERVKGKFSLRRGFGIKKGSTVLGHEFHYSTVIEINDAPIVYVKDAYQNELGQLGSINSNATGTFFHLIGVEQWLLVSLVLVLATPIFLQF